MVERLSATQRKEIQTARMWRYFLDATSELMKEKQLDHITIRQIADRAGYTSSTVYNYFGDLSHLKFFAAMRFTRSYLIDLPAYMEKGTNTIDKWLYAWECFCRHSFALPEVYRLLYIEDLGDIPEELIRSYHRTYENELIDLSEEVQTIITQHNIATRSSLYIQDAVKEGLMDEQDIEYIAGTTMHIWMGMLISILNKRKRHSQEKAAQQTMHYIYKSILYTVHPNKREQIAYRYDSSL